jgi:hypothetical protein
MQKLDSVRPELICFPDGSRRLVHAWYADALKIKIASRH